MKKQYRLLVGSVVLSLLFLVGLWSGMQSKAQGKRDSDRAAIEAALNTSAAGKTLPRKHSLKERNQNQIENRRDWRSHQTPSDCRVPHGCPEKLRRAPEMGAKHCQNLGGGKGQAWRAEKLFSQPEKRKQKRDLCGIHKIIHNLNRRKIQPQDQRRESA